MGKNKKIKTVKTTPKNNSKLIIEIKDLKKAYHNKVIFNGLNFSIYEGDRIALIGKNGIGKSTLTELICGVKEPDSGTITRNLGANKQDIAKSIGVQFQESNYPDGVKVKTMIRFYKNIYNNDSIPIDKLVKEFQLTKLLKKPIKVLSGGQKQRLNVMLGILHNPKLLFLDELTTGLDILTAPNIRKFIKGLADKYNWSLVLVTHNIDDINEICNKVAFISEQGIKEVLTIEEINKKHKSIPEYVRKNFELTEKNRSKNV